MSSLLSLALLLITAIAIHPSDCARKKAVKTYWIDQKRDESERFFRSHSSAIACAAHADIISFSFWCISSYAWPDESVINECQSDISPRHVRCSFWQALFSHLCVYKRKKRRDAT